MLDRLCYFAVAHPWRVYCLVAACIIIGGRLEVVL